MRIYCLRKCTGGIPTTNNVQRTRLTKGNKKMRIWKCDSNWGGRRVLDLFVDYRCVFFGTDVNKVGHYWEVSPGDLIAISRGTEIVAIAEAKTPFMRLKEMSRRVTVPRVIREQFDNTDVEPFGCEISDVCWLSEPIVNGKRMSRFFEIRREYDLIKAAWEDFKNTPRDNCFDIKSRTASLCGEPDSIFCGEQNRYVIPVYQRPYAWGEEQIGRLLGDIKEAFDRQDKMFVGTIQVSAPIKIDDDKNSFNLIDGQQRLSTLLMLLKMLGVDYTEKLRTVVNKGAAQQCWDDYCDWVEGKDVSKEAVAVNAYIHAALYIRSWLDDLRKEQELDEAALCEFVKSGLRFVVIETQAGISKTLEIFNVINTAGMDLNASDIFKIRFFEYLCPNGLDDSLFQQISNCYRQIEDRNRSLGVHVIGMDDVLACFQRVIVAKFGMNAETYSMSSSQFFERLFDYLINGKKWPGFYDALGIQLGIKDLQKVVRIMLKLDAMRREDSRLRLICNFLNATRYGWYAKHMLAVACFFDVVPEDDAAGMAAFNERLFKKLVPASIGFSKVVNPIRTSKLLELLRRLASGNADEVNSHLSTDWGANGYSEASLVESGLNQEIAWVAPWKNLLCRMVEYLVTLQDAGNGKQGLEDADWRELDDRLFGPSFDIEHIQSYTDIDNAEEVRRVWGAELNSLGNLSLLEFDINRSIQNAKYVEKCKAYRNSVYRTLHKVVDDYAEWNKSSAVARREQLSGMIKEYLASI